MNDKGALLVTEFAPMTYRRADRFARFFQYRAEVACDHLTMLAYAARALEWALIAKSHRDRRGCGA